MKFRQFWPSIILVFSLTLSGASGRLWAEPPQLAVTIEQAVETALEKNASLGRDVIDLASRKRQNDYAFAGILPTLSISTGLSRNNFGIDTSSNGYIPWTNSNSLGLSLNLALTNWIEIVSAKVNYQASAITYERARHSIEKSVRTAFYGLLLLQATLRLEEQAFERASNHFQQISESYRAGLVSDLDVMTVQVTMLAAQPAVEAQRTNLTKQMGLFRQLLGFSVDQEIVLVGELGTDLPDGFTAILPAGKESADLVAAKVNLAGAERIHSIQRWTPWLPVVSLTWNLAPTRTNLTNPATTWTDSTGGFSLGLSFTLNNLLPWSPTAETVAQSNDQIRKYQSLISELSETQRLNRQNNLLQIQQSIQAIDRLKITAALAERAYALNKEAYQKGTKDWLSLQSIEGEMQKARFNVISERYNLMIAVLNFENDENLAFGTMIGGSK